MKKHIPNFITLLNLASGTVALYLVLNGSFKWALGMLLAAALFDFFDGFAARLLKTNSEIGKQLDSLADLISFGLVPASMIFMILKREMMPYELATFGALSFFQKVMLASVVLVPMFSALRLAKFNLQSDTSDFMGLPTPAFAIFWSGIYYDMYQNSSIFGQTLNPWFFWGLMLLMTLFMVVPVPMLSLKFKSFNFIKNFSRYLLMVLAVVIIAFTGLPGLALLILTYILLSLVRIVLT